jgi:ATP synthase F1 delta subunit
MENLTVSAVYGEGLFEAASDVGNIDGIGRELENIERIFRENPLFFELLKTPTLPVAERKSVARTVFEGRIAPELLNFIFILIDRRRIGQLRDIAQTYGRLSDAREGFVKGKIYSAVELSKEQLGRFEEETGKLLKKRVKLQNESDASLLGGVCIYIDGKLIDASVRGRLNNLRERVL